MKCKERSRQRSGSLLCRMDFVSITAQLERAQRDVIEGEVVLERQKEVIRFLERAGRDVSVATQLLRSFERAQACSVMDRDKLLARLGRP